MTWKLLLTLETSEASKSLHRIQSIFTSICCVKTEESFLKLIGSLFVIAKLLSNSYSSLSVVHLSTLAIFILLLGSIDCKNPSKIHSVLTSVKLRWKEWLIFNKFNSRLSIMMNLIQCFPIWSSPINSILKELWIISNLLRINYKEIHKISSDC